MSCASDAEQDDATCRSAPIWSANAARAASLVARTDARSDATARVLSATPSSAACAPRSSHSTRSTRAMVVSSASIRSDRVARACTVSASAWTLSSRSGRATCASSAARRRVTSRSCWLSCLSVSKIRPSMASSSIASLTVLNPHRSQLFSRSATIRETTRHTQQGRPLKTALTPSPYWKTNPRGGLKKPRDASKPRKSRRPSPGAFHFQIPSTPVHGRHDIPKIRRHIFSWNRGEPPRAVRRSAGMGVEHFRRHPKIPAALFANQIGVGWSPRRPIHDVSKQLHAL